MSSFFILNSIQRQNLIEQKIRVVEVRPLS